jgi:hypothetical protein
MAMIDIAEATRAINSKNRVAFHHFHHSLDIALRAPFAVLPILRFADNGPVILNRHTLSTKPGQLSLLSMHGRRGFDLTQSPIKRAIFQKAELRELVLDERADMVFDFCFDLGSVDQTALSDGDVPAVPCLEGAMPSGLIPEHVSVEVTP